MISLAAPVLAELARAVEAAYPEEGCGLLVGAWDEDDTCNVDRIVESANLADDPRRHFFVDIRLLLSLQKQLRGTRERIVGVYHSHPDGVPAPSETDQARAFDRDLVWLIASVRAGRFEALKAYSPGDPGGDFAELDLQTGS